MSSANRIALSRISSGYFLGAATALILRCLRASINPGAVQRRLFCDPTDGRLLTMESTAALFTGGLRQFGCWRDQVDRLTGGQIGDLDHVRDRAAGGATTAANAQALGVLTNRVVKNHPRVSARVVPVAARGDGLDGYRTNAPDIEWRLPSGQHHLSRPPPVLGPGSDPHHLPASPDDSWFDRAALDTEQCPAHAGLHWQSPGDLVDPAETATDNQVFIRLEAAS
jgi:hypothetical protein